MQDKKKKIQFSLDLSEYRAHIFKLSMFIEAARPEQKLSLPAWTPGSYMMREFSQHIVSLSAFENDCKIEALKTNKNTYELQNKGPKVVISYEIYAFDSSIRAAFIDNAQAFFNGTALFFRPHGMEDSDFIVNILQPPSELIDWEVATGMEKIDIDSCGFGTYRARSYEELVDHPCQISPMKRLKYTAHDTPHEMLLVGDVRPHDEERLKKDLAKLCGQHIKMFGDKAPFEKYSFIARFEEGGYGGLEHRNSSMLLSSPYCLPKVNMVEPDNNYRNFLSLCSHEYFHAWNVKRLKPHNFVSYDFDQECYTTMLWLFEGITSYYDDLLVKKAGLISAASYLELISKSYGRLLRNPGRHVQSVADSSFDAWIKFYRQNENSLNCTVSYYLKGSFIGLYLDLSIRLKSNHQRSLDDLMKLAFLKFPQGIEEHEFLALLEEMAELDSKDLKENIIYGTKELPIPELVCQFGIDCLFLPDDMTIDEKTKMQAFLGLKMRFDDNARAIVSFVERNGPSMRAGLSPFDELVAVNGTRLDPSNIMDLFSSIKEDDHLEIIYSRKKMVRKTTLFAEKLPSSMCKFSLNPNLDQKERCGLEKWFGSIEIQPSRNSLVSSIL